METLWWHHEVEAKPKTGVFALQKQKKILGRLD
jgi:hypothetical protein